MRASSPRLANPVAYRGDYCTVARTQSGKPVPSPVRESLCRLLLHSSLPPNWTADVPTVLLRSKVGGQSRGYVMLGIPNGHEFQVLNRWVVHPRLMDNFGTLPDGHLEGSYRPLNHALRSTQRIHKLIAPEFLPSSGAEGTCDRGVCDGDNSHHRRRKDAFNISYIAVSSTKEADRFLGGDLPVIDPATLAYECIERSCLQVGSRL